MNATPGGKKLKKSGERPSLSDQGHGQIMDYLNAAEKSSYPAIRAAALELAREAAKAQRRQAAKLSPLVTMLSATAVLVLAGGLCWFFFLHYPERLAFVLSAVVIGLAIVAICMYLLLSGHLTQTNFMSVLKMVWTRILVLIPGSASTTVAAVSAGEASADPGNDDEPPSGQS